MKTGIKNLFLLPALIAALGLIPAGWVAAQTFTTLHNFAGVGSPGNEGVQPWAGLILSGNTLYGTTEGGGTWANGTVFKVNTDGTGFKTLHSFYGSPKEGTRPYADLILSGNILYGTTSTGGSSVRGTAFAVNTDGTGFTNLHSFTDSFTGGSDGGNPWAGLVLSGNTLFGTASIGGSSGNGTVFAINTDGTGFTNMHSLTNGDGNHPYGGLILLGNTLYGTTHGGGLSGDFDRFGTVFKVNTNSVGFTNLHSFTETSTSSRQTNSDGAAPYAGLILSDNILYGTASTGGSSGNGTVFAVNTDGTGFTNLHSFAAGLITNSDGAQPHAGLILSGNTLYGTAAFGGNSGRGTVFAVNTDGMGFTNLHSFTDIYSSTRQTNTDGAWPYAGLILSGNTLYGTASGGGSKGYGTMFSLSFVPQLSIVPSGANVILSWPTNVAGFDYTGYTLQSTTNLGSSAVWTTVSPGPVVANGQNSVTNPVSGTQQFYRLIQ